MSFETWKEEFYPIGAESVEEENALDHALRKWIGLRPDNLEKHGIEAFKTQFHVKAFWRVGTKGGDRIEINTESCALCTWYWRDDSECTDDGYDDDACCNCPLYKLDNSSCDVGTDAPFWAYCMNGDPEPMIELLQKAVKILESK